MKKFFRLIYIFPCLLLLFAATGCSHDEPTPVDEQEKHRVLTVLLYAVNDNTLNSFFPSDMHEIEQALKKTDTQGIAFIVYDAGYKKSDDGLTVYPLEKASPRLWEFRKNGDSVTRVELKEYDTSLSSVSEKRMSEVMSDVRELRPADTYGLFLWSHAMGWTHSPDSFSRDVKRYFGDDMGEHMNIDRLAEAIPDGMFRFIWMDCCYMGNIESLYQLRHKTEKYIASATETIADGAPYHHILPFLLKADPEEEKAAESMFDYYDRLSGAMRSCTIAVFSCDALEALAASSRKLLAESFTPSQTADHLQIYSRAGHGPFYDFADYMKQVSPDASPETLSGFSKSLADCITYKAATETFLIGYPGWFEIDKEKYSGISCHRMLFDESENENYYKSLDWYQSVYPL